MILNQQKVVVIDVVNETIVGAFNSFDDIDREILQDHLDAYEDARFLVFVHRPDVPSIVVKTQPIVKVYNEHGHPMG